MAYSILYTAQFKDRTETDTFKVEVLQDNYAGSSSTISYMTPDPVQVKYGSKKGEEQYIMGSFLTFSFISIPSDNDKYDAIFEGDIKEFKLNSLLRILGILIMAFACALIFTDSDQKFSE